MRVFKNDYISAMNKLKFKENLKQETMRRIRNTAFKNTLNWKYKFIIVLTTLEVYFLSFGSVTCR